MTRVELVVTVGLDVDVNDPVLDDAVDDLMAVLEHASDALRSVGYGVDEIDIDVAGVETVR